MGWVYDHFISPVRRTYRLEAWTVISINIISLKNLDWELVLCNNPAISPRRLKRLLRRTVFPKESLLDIRASWIKN
jgi:hypothetical protein